MFARSIELYRECCFPRFYLCNCPGIPGDSLETWWYWWYVCAHASVTLLLQWCYQNTRNNSSALSTDLSVQHSPLTVLSAYRVCVLWNSSFMFICRLTGRERRNVLSHFLGSVLISMLSLMIHSCLIVREVSQETAPATLVHPVPNQSSHLSHR